MEPSNFDQLQGKRNARPWRRQFKVAALGKGVWDVFNGIYTAVTCPDPKDYRLENAQTDAGKNKDDEPKSKDDEKKGKRKTRTTLGPDEVNQFIKQAAESADDQKKGLDFNSRMTLYKFTLDEYDKGRKIIATAMALLITWVHPSLRGQLESFSDPKEAYDHLISRYSITDARAREMAENQFNGIYMTRFASAQDYVNAIENAKEDILEAGGYCDDPMMISKIVRGLRGHPMYKDFATQYHLLRDIDSKFENLDHVITQLLTFESSNFPEPDFRISQNRSTNGYQDRSSNGYQNRSSYQDARNYVSENGNRPAQRYATGMRGQRAQRELCNACGIWGHNEAKCFKAHPEQRPANNVYAGRSANGNNVAGNNFNRGTKPKGMAATTIVDNTEFVNALNGARLDSMKPKPEGTTTPTLTQITSAKDYSQATSLREIGCKGELSKEEGLCLGRKGVQESLSQGLVFNNKCQPSFVSGNSQCTTMRNNKVDFSTTRSLICTPQNVEDAFIQAPFINSEPAIQNVCFTSGEVPVDSNAWILDSGANIYICNNPAWFERIYNFDTTVSTAGHGSAMHIVGGGTVVFHLQDGDGDAFELTLNDVAYAPASRCNLISISKLAQAGVHGSWDPSTNNMELRTAEGYNIGNAKQEGGLYQLQLVSTPHTSPSSGMPFVANVDFADPVWMEHRRLGHLSLQRMIQLCEQSTGMTVTKGQIQAKLGQICPVCATTRAIVRVPRDPAKVRYDTKGQLVHVDIWGPYPVTAYDGTKWMIFSTDDATRATKTLRLKSLAEFPQLLRELHKSEERKYQIMILRYRVDNQFNQGPWKEWCKKKGITIEPIAPHAHHQVGVAERVNRTLREGASAIIQDNAIGHQIRKILEERGNEFLRNSTLPENLWPEAIEYATWLKNRTPTRALKSKKTPWESEEKQQPDLSREKTWGSRMYVSYTDEERHRKLHDPRGWLGYFVGCENESTYRVWNPDTKRVRRVAYTIVEDGQGLDDPHDDQNANDRITREPLQPVANGTESDSNPYSDDDISDVDNDQNSGHNIQDSVQMGHRSRFFARPAAMVTQRNDPRKDNSQSDEDRPLLEQDDSPIEPYEDTYVPLRRTVAPGTSSPFFKAREDIDTHHNDEGSNPSEHDEEDFGDFQSSMIDEEESFHSMNPPPELEQEESLTLIPVRNRQFRTPNQLPAMDTEEDDDAIIPKPDKKNDRTKAIATAKRFCGNDLCSTPHSPVWPKQMGPNGEILCKNCNRRYLAQLQSKIARHPDHWKYPKENTARKDLYRSKATTELDSSDSDENQPITTKSEKDIGARIKARVRDRDRCQYCFDNARNCQMEGESCIQCEKAQIRCHPIALGPDGTLPSSRRFVKTPVQQDNELTWGERCYPCRQRRTKCDAPQPIDPKNPCSKCQTKNSYCISMEQAERVKTLPACQQCLGRNRKGHCNRLEPCDICIDNAYPKCTYESPDKTHKQTTLTNPVQPGDRRYQLDANADFYDPDVPLGCTRCGKKYGAQRGLCTFERGGPPCMQCYRSRDPSSNWCTTWIAPGKTEAVATRMYMLDEDTNELIRDPSKSSNTTNKKRSWKSRDAEDASTLNSNSESDFETSHARIMTEESRAVARKKLMHHKLPDAFLTAFSLAALQDPVDVALLPDPQSYSEAMRSPDSRKWVDAIQAEYDSLMENNTWKVAILPPGRKALTTKWVLKKKLGPVGEILKYKARMVARGFQQVEGYDYTETYSGVVKAAAYRLMFALMVLNKWTCHQMDVSTAFLNGDVLEEIYIHPPQGYTNPGKVLRLLKALYGLKQSPRLWYRKLRQWLLDNGWEVSKYDECVFYNKTQQLIITVYVDDINIFGPSDDHIIPFKSDITKAFKMTDAGRASWYLGMQLNWLPDGLHIHQNGFIQQALGKYGLLGSKPATIPLDPNRKLLKETENTADPKFKTAYMSMVGSLNYLQTKTVWGLAFPVSLVSRYMTNPNQTHLDAVLQIFRYLLGTPDRGLFFRKDGDSTLRGFVDSDWGGDTDTGKSTTGWVFTLAGCPISWSSQRQKTVSSSSTEAEYIAASDACKEAIWLKGFHNEIALAMKHPEQIAIPLSIDNASALKLTKNPEFHGRTKHINIRYHFIRECVDRGEIVPEWISGKSNPADLFTKALSKALFSDNLSRLGRGLPGSSTSGTSKSPDGHGLVLEGEQ